MTLLTLCFIVQCFLLLLLFITNIKDLKYNRNIFKILADLFDYEKGKSNEKTQLLL